MTKRFGKQKNTQLNIKQLESAFNKALENSEQLIEDSRILFHNNRFQRSFFISSIAKEEIGKAAHLKFTYFKISFGIPIDWKDFWDIFYNHMSKRKYILLIEQIIQFLIGQKIEINEINRIEEDQKLASLYTDYYDIDFQGPIDIIGEDDARMKLEDIENLYRGFARAVGKYKPTEEELKREQEELEKLESILSKI